VIDDEDVRDLTKIEIEELDAFWARNPDGAAPIDHDHLWLLEGVYTYANDLMTKLWEAPWGGLRISYLFEENWGLYRDRAVKILEVGEVLDVAKTTKD